MFCFMALLYDIHAHLEHPMLSEDLDKIIQRAKEFLDQVDGLIVGLDSLEQIYRPLTIACKNVLL